VAVKRRSLVLLITALATFVLIVSPTARRDLLALVALSIILYAVWAVLADRVATPLRQGFAKGYRRK
jgi:hypothetical protein